MQEEVDFLFLPLARTIFCRAAWVDRHLHSDWLAGTWIFFYGTLAVTIGSIFFVFESYMRFNRVEIFVWSLSVVDSIVFLIGAMYYVAGTSHNIPVHS